MTGYFVTYVIGVILHTTGWIVIGRAIREGKRLTMERAFNAGTVLYLLAPIGGVMAFVGAVGITHEAGLGQMPPIPLGVVWGLILAWVVLLAAVQPVILFRTLRVIRRRKREQRAEP